MHPLQRLSRLPLYWQVLPHQRRGVRARRGRAADLAGDRVPPVLPLRGGGAASCGLAVMLARQRAAAAGRAWRPWTGWSARWQVVELHDGQRLDRRRATGPGARLVGELQRDARPARGRAQRQQRPRARRPGGRAAPDRPGAARPGRAGPHRGAARAEAGRRTGPGRRWSRSWSCCARAPAPASTTYAGWRGELRPGVLDDLGLGSALAALCSDFTAHGGAPGAPRPSPRACPTSARSASWWSTGSRRRR